MFDHEHDVLFKRTEVEEAIRKNAMMVHGACINDLPRADIHVVGILNGCYPFMSKFIEEFPARAHVMIDHAMFVGGDVIMHYSQQGLDGAVVILLDDICDGGDTIEVAAKHIEHQWDVVRVLTCTLVDRPERHKGVTVHFPCLRIPEEAGWIIGWGMDRGAGDGRYLMDICHEPVTKAFVEGLSWLGEDDNGHTSRL